MRLGIVDLDTSHPAAWIPLERALGHEITAVWDGGAVHPPEYVAAFAREHGIPRVCPALPELVPEVDAVVIHGCDWDTHVEKARPFVEAGKAVLIDKPFAGRIADLELIAKWIRQGARIAGGSALRFSGELQAWLEKPPAERGTPQTAFAGCGVDDFNYGIHAYSLACAAMGPGLRSVRQLGAGAQRRVELYWPEGRTAVLAVGRLDVWIPFHLSLVTERSVFQVVPNHLNLYEAILRACLPYLAGTASAPVPLESLFDPERAALAAQRSAREDGREVRLDEITAEDRYDGATFAVGYRALRYPVR